MAWASTKAGANYAASLLSAMKAKKDGYDQVLWLDGKDHEFVEEVGTMNVCFLIGNSLVTPPLSDSILAGVTRDSVLMLAQGAGLQRRRAPRLHQGAAAAHQSGTLKEVFGTGTAAVISPVGELAFAGEKLIINEGKPGTVAAAALRRDRRHSAGVPGPTRTGGSRRSTERAGASRGVPSPHGAS